MYKQFLVYKSDFIYDMLSNLMITPTTEPLDGIKILFELEAKNEWAMTDSEFILLKNTLGVVGGIVSFTAYEFYCGYICRVPLEKWTYRFLKLCSGFLEMSPVNARKSFSMEFEGSTKSKNIDQHIISAMLKREK